MEPIQAKIISRTVPLKDQIEQIMLDESVDSKSACNLIFKDRLDKLLNKFYGKVIYSEIENYSSDIITTTQMTKYILDLWIDFENELRHIDVIHSPINSGNVVCTFAIGDK